MLQNSDNVTQRCVKLCTEMVHYLRLSAAASCQLRTQWNKARNRNVVKSQSAERGCPAKVAFNKVSSIPGFHQHVAGRWTSTKTTQLGIGRPNTVAQ